MGLGLTGKLETADNTLETLTLGRADDVHKLTILEVGHGPLCALGGGPSVLESELADEALGCGSCLCEMALLGLGDAMLFLVAEANLNGVVTILLLALDLENAIAACLDDSHGANATLRVIDTGHADFFT